MSGVAECRTAWNELLQTSVLDTALTLHPSVAGTLVQASGNNVVKLSVQMQVLLPVRV
jgi:hypothetical protein